VPRAARTDTRVDLVLAGVCGVAALVCLILPAPMRNATAAALRGTMVAPLAALQERAELGRKAFLARDEALRVADSVTLRSQRLAGVEEENERLRRLLGLAAAVQWGFVPAEVLQGRGLGDEFTATLSAGRREGVEAFSPVIAPEGLVGMVEQADATLSLAILWPHPDFRVSAMVADGSAYGIVGAHLGGQGAERYLLELRSVPLRAPLKPGALVVSSGLGGVYPKGIPVGTVVSELKTGESYARTYLLRPVVKLPDVASVLIVGAARVRAGLESAWEVGAATDAATRRVVRAADSLAALSRRRTADSLARAAARPESTRKVP